ncbi:MAG: leucine-rich repeat domain-containing protein [Promethearchaeota archaeon]
MKEPFTPEKIYNDIKSGKSSKSEIIEVLISLIEGSNEPIVREKSIEVCEHLSLKTKKIFKILENSLISDESALVRSAAAKAIFNNFLEANLSSLKWAIQHDKSPIVMKTIFKLFKDDNNQNHKFIIKELDKWIDKFALALGLVTDEVKFILDLEALFAKNGGNYEINTETYKYYQILTDKDGKPWFEIQNNHITGLTLNFYNWKFIKENPKYADYLSSLIYLNLFLSALKKINIDRTKIREVPESIGSLILLERLNLSRNNIKEIPLSIFQLISLKWLDLSHNSIREIPESIINLRSLTKLKLNHNCIKEIPDSIKSFLNSLEYFSI